eukprot:3185045-Prymnesium_polylepis.2
MIDFNLSGGMQAHKRRSDPLRSGQRGFGCTPRLRCGGLSASKQSASWPPGRPVRLRAWTTEATFRQYDAKLASNPGWKRICSATSGPGSVAHRAPRTWPAHGAPRRAAECGSVARAGTSSMAGPPGLPAAASRVHGIEAHG